MKCLTPDGLDELGNQKWKEKRKYSTLDEAIRIAKIVNIDPNRPRKVIAYKCPNCHQYHIGRGSRKIKDSDRDRILRELRIGKGT